MTQIVYPTRTFYFPAVQHPITLLLTPPAVSGLIPSICNVLILRNRLVLQPGQYDVHYVIQLIRNCCPTSEDLTTFIPGCFVCPCFSSCRDFRYYPLFLTQMQINVYHTMVPDPSMRLCSLITRHDWASLNELVQSGEFNKQDTDELNEWIATCPMVTGAAVNDLHKVMGETESALYLIANQYFVVFKYGGRVYMFNPDPRPTNPQVIWEDPPMLNAQLYNENFQVIGRIEKRAKKKEDDVDLDIFSFIETFRYNQPTSTYYTPINMPAGGGGGGGADAGHVNAGGGSENIVVDGGKGNLSIG